MRTRKEPTKRYDPDETPNWGYDYESEKINGFEDYSFSLKQFRSCQRIFDELDIVLKYVTYSQDILLTDISSI